MSNPLRILADENIPEVERVFAHLGPVSTCPGRDINRERLADVDVLLVRSVTRVNAALLEGTPVRFVGSATIGHDHIDSNYLQSRGIRWANAPGSNAESVVDYVISALCRLQGTLRHLLDGGTLGIVGMGNVGSRLYSRLRSLGIRCVAYDPLLPRERYPVLDDLDNVLQADVICLHAPLTREGPFPSYHMLDAERLQRLRPEAVLISAGRGAVVDTRALYALLQRREDICVALDVWENEPDIDIDLMQRVDLATPHIAGYSHDGKLAGTELVYRACCAFFRREPEETVQAPPVTAPIVVREHVHPSLTACEAVRAAYDIAADDQRLRGAVLHAEAGDAGAAFDRLRRTYPERREFSCFRVTADPPLSPAASRFLAALGFRPG